MPSLVDALKAPFTYERPAVVPTKRSSTMESSLRGSAKVNTSADKKSAAGDARTWALSRGWQQQAWGYYDDGGGELHFSGNFVGNCLSRCTLTVGVRDSQGRIAPVFGDDDEPLPEYPDAQDALDIVLALRNEIGGQSSLLRTMGINLMVAAECHLVGTPPDGRDPATTPIQEMTWEVLSVEEFRRSGNDYVRHSIPGGQGEQIRAESIYVARIWRSHPRYGSLPDSSIKPLLTILEELELLTREVRGEAMSRLSNAKLLLVPEEIQWGEEEEDDADTDAGDAFTRDLIRTLSTPITDKGSAAAVVPFVVRAPQALLHPDGFREIDLSPQNTSDSAAKRIEAVKRFAQGIDLPVEIVTGMAGTTFANAVVIDDSTFKVHIEPLLDLICDALTASVLRPALGTDTNYVVHFDATELVSRPNRSQDAKDVYDRWELSGSSLRNSTGFSETDAPEPDEVAERIRIKQLTQIRQTVPTTPAGIAAEDQGIGADVSAVEDGPGSNGPGSPVQQGQASNTASLAASIAFASEVAIDRAVRRAGARLRSKAAKEPMIRDQLSQCPNAEIPVTLGPTLVARFIPDDDLFYDEFDTLESVVRRSTGDPQYAADLKTRCEEIARERMYQPRQPFPFDRIPAPNGHVTAR